MKTLIFRGVALLGLLTVGLLAAPAVAERPDCATNPTKPGACFVQSEEGFEFFIGCGFPWEGGVVEGLMFWPVVGNADNDFARVNSDGTTFLHISDREVPVVFCPWDLVFAGLCTPDSPVADLLYYGLTDFQANGITEGVGDLGCPFVMTAMGEVFRPADGHTIPVRPTLKFVPDDEQPDACRLQTCRIFKPGYVAE